MSQESSVKAPTELYDAYIFDMDGTIYLGEELLPGAKRLIEQLHAWNIPVRYLSNNPTKDPLLYSQKLERLGLPTPVNEITNTVVAMTRWLSAHHPGKVVFPIAEAPLINAFKTAGIPLSEDPKEIDIVVASYDRSFEYRKLQIAFDAIWYHKRAILVATNPDRYCPFPGGKGEPDCAAIIAAIEACTGTKCQANLGKPNPEILQAALEDLKVNPKNCIMVGDRLSTDIQMALRTNMHSALPLTGDSTLAEVKNLDPKNQPEFVLSRIDQLIPARMWPELGWNKPD